MSGWMPGVAHAGAGPTTPTGWHWLRPLDRMLQNGVTAYMYRVEQ
jgi:hypothetical protein